MSLPLLVAQFFQKHQRFSVHSAFKVCLVTVSDCHVQSAGVRQFCRRYRPAFAEDQDFIAAWVKRTLRLHLVGLFVFRGYMLVSEFVGLFLAPETAFILLFLFVLEGSEGLAYMGDEFAVLLLASKSGAWLFEAFREVR